VEERLSMVARGEVEMSNELSNAITRVPWYAIWLHSAFDWGSKLLITRSNHDAHLSNGFDSIQRKKMQLRKYFKTY
jgi:hypothetical protein